MLCEGHDLHFWQMASYTYVCHKKGGVGLLGKIQASLVSRYVTTTIAGLDRAFHLYKGILQIKYLNYWCGYFFSVFISLVKF